MNYMPTYRVGKIKSFFYMFQAGDTGKHFWLCERGRERWIIKWMRTLGKKSLNPCSGKVI